MGRRKTLVNGERKTQQQLSDEYRRRTYCNADLLQRIFVYIGLDSYPTTERPTDRNSKEFEEYSAQLDQIVVNLFEKHREQLMKQESIGFNDMASRMARRESTPSVFQQKQQFDVLSKPTPIQKSSSTLKIPQPVYKQKLGLSRSYPNASFLHQPSFDSQFDAPYVSNNQVVHSPYPQPNPQISPSNSYANINFPPSNFVQIDETSQQTNSSTSTTNSYDRTFFDWLDEQIFEIRTDSLSKQSQSTIDFNTSLPNNFNQQTFDCSQTSRRESDNDSTYSDFSDSYQTAYNQSINASDQQPLQQNDLCSSNRQQQIKAFLKNSNKKVARPKKRSQPSTISREMAKPPPNTSSTAQPGQISLKKQKDELENETWQKLNTSMYIQMLPNEQKPKESRKLFAELIKMSL